MKYKLKKEFKFLANNPKSVFYINQAMLDEDTYLETLKSLGVFDLWLDKVDDRPMNWEAMNKSQTHNNALNSIELHFGKKYSSFIKVNLLKDEWNRVDDFVPDKSNCIKVFDNIFSDSDTPLTFKDEETAQLFDKTFKSLIKECEELI